MFRMIIYIIGLLVPLFILGYNDIEPDIQMYVYYSAIITVLLIAIEIGTDEIIKEIKNKKD